jgi:hypothetical protein
LPGGTEEYYEILNKYSWAPRDLPNIKHKCYMLDREGNLLKNAHFEDLEGDVRIILTYIFGRITMRIGAA